MGSFYETIRFRDPAFPICICHTQLPAAGDEPVALDTLAHWHEYLEFHWFGAGGTRVLTGNEWHVAEPGAVTVVNSSELHTLLPGDQPSDYWYFILGPELLGGDSADATGDFWRSLTSQQIRFQNYLPPDSRLNQLFSAIVEEYSTKRPGYELAIRGHIFTLMALLLREYRLPAVDAAHRHQDRRLKEVLLYITEQYAQPITPQSMANVCGLNLSYFCRLFHRGTGMTATAYLTAYRLTRAEKLLVTTDLPVSEIAVRVGFSDIAYFSRCFKRHYGISPLKYRRNNMNIKE